MASDIKTSQLCYLICACIRHYFPRRQGNRSGPQLASLRHGRLTPARISPGCPPCLRLGLGRSIIIPGGVIAKQPATGCFVDGWVPLRTLCAALIGASVEGRDFPSRLSPYRWSWRILQRRFSPPPGGLSPANVSRCRVFTCQGDSQSLNSDDGSGFYMAGELD